MRLYVFVDLILRSSGSLQTWLTVYLFMHGTLVMNMLLDSFVAETTLIPYKRQPDIYLQLLGQA
jgi:hypothetical protein